MTSLPDLELKDDDDDESSKTSFIIVSIYTNYETYVIYTNI